MLLALPSFAGTAAVDNVEIGMFKIFEASLVVLVHGLFASVVAVRPAFGIIDATINAEISECLTLQRFY